MNFDLTRQITLDKRNFKIYRILQITFYVTTFVIATYLAIQIFFPSLFFQFNFLNPNSNNTVINPRDESQQPLDHGKSLAGKNFFFDTSLTDSFSRIALSFSLNKKSADFSSDTITARKSYTAFLYPIGENFGFKNGSLLKNSGRYYIISNNQLRQFISANIVLAMGYAPENFTEVSSEELQYNPIGESIVDSKNYPNDSIFKIDDDYYALQNNQLKKFVSATAFLNQYKTQQALEKNASFLSAYPLSEDLLGFANDSFVSYGNSIYALADGKYFPIDSPATFLGKGFSWDDVISISPAELALYQKNKLFTTASQHLNGTIFKTIENGTYYLVQDGRKHLLPSEKIAASWLHNSAISVSESSINITDNCQLKKSFWGTYECEIPIENMHQLLGSDYEFVVKPSTDIKMDAINIEFKKDINWQNFRLTLSTIFSDVKKNYAQKN